MVKGSSAQHSPSYFGLNDRGVASSREILGSVRSCAGPFITGLEREVLKFEFTRSHLMLYPARIISENTCYPASATP